MMPWITWKCPACQWRGRRYHNVRLCPRCRGDLVKSELPETIQLGDLTIQLWETKVLAPDQFIFASPGFAAKLEASRRRYQEDVERLIMQEVENARVRKILECDHPWHNNPHLTFPCPACGAGGPGESSRYQSPPAPSG